MDGSHCVATIRLPFALTIDATFMIESPSHVFSRCESGRRSRNASIIGAATRSEEHTSELQSLMRISYAVFCLKKTINSHLYRSYMSSTNNYASPYNLYY